jgi:hypothetical protein
MPDIVAPEWLTKRGGAFQEGTVGQSWLVLLNGEPQYRLTPVPAAGHFGCQIAQTVNGRRFDSPETYPSRDSALQGGLDTLRKALGW